MQNKKDLKNKFATQKMFLTFFSRLKWNSIFIMKMMQFVD